MRAKHWLALFYFTLWYLGCAGCARVEIGPFVPRDAIRCSDDWDCIPDREQCRFPGVDRPSVCMPVAP